MAKTVVSPIRLVIPNGQRLKWAPAMARALGPGEDTEAHPELPEETPHFRSGRQPEQRAQAWLGVEEVQVRPTQLLFIFFLLGSCPKQTNQGGKMKGT